MAKKLESFTNESCWHVISWQSVMYTWSHSGIFERGLMCKLWYPIHSLSRSMCSVCNKLTISYILVNLSHSLHYLQHVLLMWYMVLIWKCSFSIFCPFCPFWLPCAMCANQNMSNLPVCGLFPPTYHIYHIYYVVIQNQNDLILLK
jgi:hypothetical protein